MGGWIWRPRRIVFCQLLRGWLGAEKLLAWTNMSESLAAGRAKMSVFWWIGWRKKRVGKRILFLRLKGLVVVCT